MMLWIVRNVIVIPGIKIGTGSIICAGDIITSKDVESILL